MTTRLQHLFDALEKEHQQILSAIEVLTDEEFRTRTNPSKWSVSEILAHLQTSEQLSTQYIIKKYQGINDYQNTSFLHDMLMVFVQASQRLPFKFRAPKVVASNTPAYETKQQLIENWSKTSALMKEMLDKFDEQQLKKQIYRHPRIGLINIQHAVMFFREHMIHHRPQVLRQIKRS